MPIILSKREEFLTCEIDEYEWWDSCAIHLFACAWWCGGLSVGGGGGEVDQNIPHRWRVNQDIFFSFGDEPLWLVHHPQKKQYPSLW